MRTLIRAGALSAGVAAALVCAPAAQASAPGDNGTVKIHDARTGEELRRNEPHVCTFYLDAFGFDGVQQVAWHIEAWAPTAATKGATVKSGALTLDADGHGRSEDLSLPDGHYKLFWNFEGEKGAAKHKVFWTDCAGSQGGGGGAATPSGSASPSTSTPGTETGASAPPSGSPSQAASPGSASAPSSTPSAQGTGGDLAETGNGAPVGLLSAVAAALVGAGGGLVAWRRRARRG
ncbi:LPXTG cell wall anchor domain-containing protein [Streptomyces sp. NPDC101165]|uniref:LPXTG cell wall anchor domain-containing protein n=1 Tax=Streptomyces sp. NPDC101165 TaxID=3366119 RepID=UPI00381335B9